MLARRMPFAALTRLTGENWHRVAAISGRYANLTLTEADFPDVTRLSIDETSPACGHDYVTLAADTERRAVRH